MSESAEGAIQTPPYLP